MITMERVAIIAVLAVSALTALALSLAAWRRKKYAGASAFYLSLCMLGVAIYSFGYALEVSSNTLPAMMFWVRFEHWGIQSIAPTWLLFSLSLAGKERWITRWRLIALLIPALFLFLAAQTLGWLNLYHHNPRLDTSGPFPTFAYDRCPFTWLGIGYYNLCLALSTLLFATMLFRTAPAFRRQTAVFLIASLIPWVGMEVYLFGLTPYHLDASPLALSLSGLIFALGFLKLDVLDLMPLARDVIFEGMSDGVLVLDNRDRVIDFNPRLKAMLPEVKKTQIGYPVHEVLDAYPSLLKVIRESILEPVELQVNTPEASYFYQSNLSLLYNWRRKKIGKILILHDYTQVKHLLTRLENLATTDSLTGAYNRRYFHELAAKEIYRLQRYGGSLSLIMFDLDHFKTINDTYGHAAGDTALKTIVETCTQLLRQSDTLARFGGEEFIILLPETSIQAAVKIAEKLRTALEQLLIRHEPHSFTLTASFGVTGLNSPREISLDELYHCVDQAVYRAKEKGRNCVSVCYPCL